MLSSITTRYLTRNTGKLTVFRGAANRRALATSAFPAPRLFDYETVTSNLSVADAIESVEAAFGALAKGEVDVPMPMHIGIEETSAAGPGEFHTTL